MPAVCRHGCRSQSASAVLAFAVCQGGNSDARRQALQVDSEVHPRERLVEIVDVEQDIVLRRNECTEVHHMTVATGLNRDSGYRLVRQVCCHDGCSTAEKREAILHHACVTIGDELRKTLCIALGENVECISTTH